MEVNSYDAIADLYDVYVPAAFDINFFVQETGKTSGEVLELMSGTGRVSIPLLQAGVALTCVDISEKSNCILEHKLQAMGLSAQVHTMDVRALDLQKKFAMVIIPFHSFAHITAQADQRQMLARIREHLLPGGTFICTLGNPNVRKKSVDGQLRLVRKYPLTDPAGALLLWIVENYQADDQQVVEAMQFFEIYTAQGELTSKRLIELHFRLTQRDEFEALAKTAGFEVQAFYGDYSYAEFREDSPFMIWILERGLAQTTPTEA
jgi:SAM-dependent methyltransferase